MSFENRSTNDLANILGAGGGFVIDSGLRHKNDWIELADAAKQGGGHLTITGVSLWPTQTLVEVAFSGKGHVSFAD